MHSFRVAADGDSLRASDLDREFVVDQLRVGFEEGRLTLPEFDDRVREAYAAKTYGDLKAVLVDLPALVPVPFDDELAKATAKSRAEARRGVIVAISLLLIVVILGVALSSGLSAILGF